MNYSHTKSIFSHSVSVIRDCNGVRLKSSLKSLKSGKLGVKIMDMNFLVGSTRHKNAGCRFDSHLDQDSGFIYFQPRTAISKQIFFNFKFSNFANICLKNETKFQHIGFVNK